MLNSFGKTVIVLILLQSTFTLAAFNRSSPFSLLFGGLDQDDFNKFSPICQAASNLSLDCDTSIFDLNALNNNSASQPASVYFASCSTTCQDSMAAFILNITKSCGADVQKISSGETTLFSDPEALFTIFYRSPCEM